MSGGRRTQRLKARALKRRREKVARIEAQLSGETTA